MKNPAPDRVLRRLRANEPAKTGPAYYVVAPTGCWIWQREIHNTYGRVGWRAPDGRKVNAWAHRVMYQAFKGPIPDGLEIDHLCHVTACVNPVHLEAVTHQENVLRSSGPSARCATRTHCPEGHPYDVANTVVDEGSRRCRICRREQQRARRAAA